MNTIKVNAVVHTLASGNVVIAMPSKEGVIVEAENKDLAEQMFMDAVKVFLSAKNIILIKNMMESFKSEKKKFNIENASEDAVLEFEDSQN